MTFTRAAAVVTGGALLVAWFAVAGSTPDQDATPAPERTQYAGTSGPGSLAADVEQQAERLRQRLAHAPVPDVQPRNPFSFAPRAPRAFAVAPRGTIQAATIPPDVPEVEAPPPLVLMGIAEQPTPQGPQRTAVIGGAGTDIYMVKEGESVAGRYKVKAIGPDAIELEDLTTGGFRRLALR
jgi:hypothetical protein